MAHVINDYEGRPIGEIMRDVWDYVSGQIEVQRKLEILEEWASKHDNLRM